MDELQQILGNNSNNLEDIRWLCSLSESELDMVIGLKRLVLQRAKVIGHDELAEKFDLKMLRGLAFVLMEYLKGKLENLPHCMTKPPELLDGCNLLKLSPGDSLSIEELKACIGIDERKRQAKRPRENEAV